MNTITITEVDENVISISSTLTDVTRFYDLDNWSVGAAVENYIEDEIA